MIQSELYGNIQSLIYTIIVLIKINTFVLEKYSKKIQLAESVYAKAHNGEKMDAMKKMVVAKTLDNVNKFLTEAMDMTAATTQRGAMGEYKKLTA